MTENRHYLYPALGYRHHQVVDQEPSPTQVERDIAPAEHDDRELRDEDREIGS